MLLKITVIVSIAIHPITYNLIYPDAILTVTRLDAGKARVSCAVRTILFHPAVNMAPFTLVRIAS